VPAGSLTALKADFLADTPEARRLKLMPFFWGTLVPGGQAFGNRDVGSAARVLNAEHVSYPGYNELLTGVPDPLITSNAPMPNRNVTVLEWLHGRPGFAGRVGVAAAWRVFRADRERRAQPVARVRDPAAFGAGQRVAAHRGIGAVDGRHHADHAR